MVRCSSVGRVRRSRKPVACLGSIAGIAGHGPLGGSATESHWHSFATIDDVGPPEARVRRELYGERVYETDGSPIARLKAKIAAVNEASMAGYGHPLYAQLDPTHVQSIKVLRIPPNKSMTAFQDQLRVLAILAVDHINGKMLDSAGIVASANEGTLARLARLHAHLSQIDDKTARAQIGGLLAIQNLRSAMSAHRTGSRVGNELSRAKIALTDLPGGFVQLVMGAIDALDDVERGLRSQARVDGQTK